MSKKYYTLDLPVVYNATELENALLLVMIGELVAVNVQQDVE